MVRMPDYISSKAGAEVIGCKRCECPTIVCKKRVRKVWNFGQYIIKTGSGGVRLQKRLEYPTIVCKKRVRKGWNLGPYIIKIGSGGVWLQEGVNV